jgi:hypothetical protein
VWHLGATLLTIILDFISCDNNSNKVLEEISDSEFNV